MLKKQKQSIYEHLNFQIRDYIFPGNDLRQIIFLSQTFDIKKGF